MFKQQKIILAIFFLFFIFLLSGCTSLREVDHKLGLLLNGQDTSIGEKESGGVVSTTTPLQLSKGQKERIDLWLRANGYNRYGDKEGTYYNGGTPLFNEEIKETKERYEYIFEKHPDILSKI